MILTAPLLVLGVVSSTSFALLLVPNVWGLKLTVEGEKFSGPIGTALGVAVGVAVRVAVAVAVAMAVEVAVAVAVVV